MIIAEAPQLIQRLQEGKTRGMPAPQWQGMGVGNRNTSLTSIAGRLRRQGANVDRLEDTLLRVNEDLEQPLPPDEVRNIAGSVARYEPAPDYTEQGVATQFAHVMKKRLCFSPTFGWLLFDGRSWVTDQQGLWVQEGVKQFIDRLQDEVSSDLGMPAETRTTYGKQIRALRRAAPIANIAKLTRSEPDLLDMNSWPDRPNLLNFQNGTLELDSMRLRDHDPTDRLRSVLPYNYDPKAEAPNFSKVLNDALDPDEASFLLRLYGYALSGVGDQQKLVVFVGPGSNGKSTIAEAVRNAFGRYAGTANPETFMRQQNKPSINNDVAALDGLRLVTTSELSADQRLDAALVKRMTGGEELTARFLHKEFFSFRFRALIVMVSNFSPLFDGSDTGIARRLLFLPFDRTVAKGAEDRRMAEKLALEAPGIMNILLSGYRDYQTRGLGVPEAVQRKTADVLEDHNQILRFVNDRCVLVAGGEVKARDLFVDYENWCVDERSTRMSERAFKSAIERTTSLSQKRAAAGLKWVGLRLKSR